MYDCHNRHTLWKQVLLSSIISPLSSWALAVSFFLYLEAQYINIVMFQIHCATSTYRDSYRGQNGMNVKHLIDLSTLNSLLVHGSQWLINQLSMWYLLQHFCWRFTTLMVYQALCTSFIYLDSRENYIGPSIVNAANTDLLWLI